MIQTGKPDQYKNRCTPVSPCKPSNIKKGVPLSIEKRNAIQTKINQKACAYTGKNSGTHASRCKPLYDIKTGVPILYHSQLIKALNKHKKSPQLRGLEM